VDGGHIYWGNVADRQTPGAGTIARANLDGTGIDPNFITRTSAHVISGPAFDTPHIYCTNNHPNGSGRANLDGSGIDPSFVATGRGFPDAVAVDSGHIYWANAAGTLGRASIDGTGVDPFFIDAGEFPFGLAVDSGHLYWSHVNFSSDPNAFDD